MDDSPKVDGDGYECSCTYRGAAIPIRGLPGLSGARGHGLDGAHVETEMAGALVGEVVPQGVADGLEGQPIPGHVGLAHQFGFERFGAGIKVEIEQAGDYDLVGGIVGAEGPAEQIGAVMKAGARLVQPEVQMPRPRFPILSH